MTATKYKIGIFVLLLLGSYSVVNSKPKTNIYFQPSLFSNIPPFIHFKSIFEKRPLIPSEIQNHLLWPEAYGIRKKLQDRTFLASGHKLVSRKKLSKMSNSTTLGWLKHPGTKALLNSPVLRFQKVNSFPGMTQLSYKDTMYIHSSNFQKKNPEIHLPHVIPTFIIPKEMGKFKEAWVRTENKIWISKMPKESMHRGQEIQAHWRDFEGGKERIVQKYIHNPALYQNRKMEFQFPFFLTSVHPLRIYSLPYHCKLQLGLSNFSAELADIHDICIHKPQLAEAAYRCQRSDLYRYTVKPELNPDENLEDIDRILTEVDKKFDLGNLIKRMEQALVLSLLSVEKILTKAFYKKAINRYNFFHIIAADFVLDENGKVWLMEVNSSPIRLIHTDWEKLRHQDYLSEILNTVGYHFPPSIKPEGRERLRKTLNAVLKNDTLRSVPEPLVFDESLYGLSLNVREKKKQRIFKSINERSNYLDSILLNLTRDDLRILMVAEDELNRMRTAKRIFPTGSLYKYISYIESNNYYYKLVDAWETKYGDNRKEGRALLDKLWNAELVTS